MGAWLAHRDKYASFRHRRAIVKSRIVNLAGKGMNNAAAHLRYIQREGVSRDGEKGHLYSADFDRTDSKTFLDRAEGDRHQFRFIVPPEDGIEYDDLKSFTRRFMSNMEKDLGTHLDWVAADHYNTGHPHVHIIVRGKDAFGKDLIIAKDYMTKGMRERAALQVSLDLGPRSDLEIDAHLRAEMTAERLTSLDTQLLKMDEDEKTIAQFIQEPGQQTLLMGRLKHLERMGLAKERRRGQWHLEEDLEDTLRRMGEKGDIIKTMHREMAERDIVHSHQDYAIYDPTYGHAKPITGRVIARGLSDELNDRHYLIVDAVSGQALYIDIGLGEKTGPTPEGSIVEITPKSVEPRQVEAMGHRQKWLIEQGLAQEQHGAVLYNKNMLQMLQQRELKQIAGGIMRQTGLQYTAAFVGNHIEGVVGKMLELASGKFSVIENSREFSLVPWREVLEKNIGKQVSGIVRGDDIDWEIGRRRGLGIGM